MSKMAVKVDANPIMIKWARENAGFTLEELPDYLKDAEKWETGQDKPTWTDLRNMAKNTKDPHSFIFFQNLQKKMMT